MKGILRFLQYFLLFTLSICPSFTNAILPVKEIQASITNNHPIYEVPEGKLEEVLTGLKDYTLFALVTSSDPKYNCELCTQFDPVYEKLIRSIYRQFPIFKDRVIFIRIEASYHLDFLKKMGVKSIPQIFGFPDSKRVLGIEKFKKVSALLKEKSLSIANGEEFINPEWYDLDQAGMEHYTFEMNQGDIWDTVIAKFVDFLSTTTDVDLKSILLESKKENSIDWFMTVQWFIYVLIIIKIYQKVKETTEDGTKVWQDKRIYAYLSIVLIIIFLSGLNFTTQRHAPFVSNNKGKIMWIAPTHNQFGAEIVITILIQIGFFFASTVLLNNRHVLETEKIQNIATIVGCILLLVMLTIGVNVYHIKDRGYPFNYVNLF